MISFEDLKASIIELGSTLSKLFSDFKILLISFNSDTLVESSITDLIFELVNVLKGSFLSKLISSSDKKLKVLFLLISVFNFSFNLSNSDTGLLSNFKI